MKTYIKNTLLILAAVSLISIWLQHPIPVSAWGDSTEGGKGRPSYSLEQINEGVLGDQITFNSITITNSDYDYYKREYDGKDMSTGIVADEKNFVGARENTGVNAGTDNVWNNDDITVTDGSSYIIRLYVDNNGPNGEKGAAENTKVYFNIPNESSKQVQVNGFITSSNATPNKYWDDITFVSKNVPFHLEYIKKSALLENKGIGRDGGVLLSDNIVKAADGGVLIGYDALDGRVPGGYKYDNYITIQVKAVFDYEFSVAQKVRVVGSEDRSWKDTVDAKVGDTVEFQIEYKNNSDKRQADVAIKDTLPSNLRYVAGSTRLKNYTYKDGTKIREDYLVTDGLNIGNYGPGANALIRFYAEVVDDNLEEGGNNLINWVQAGVGDATIQDFARVSVEIEHSKVHYVILAIYAIGIVICLVLIVILMYRITKQRKINKLNHG